MKDDASSLELADDTLGRDISEADDGETGGMSILICRRSDTEMVASARISCASVGERGVVVNTT